MILKPEPIFAAVTALNVEETAHVVYLTPQGAPLTQVLAESLSLESHLILLCGRYKGIDERVRHRLVTTELSIGDYVLSGGEIAALVLIDAIGRVLPGALSDYESAHADSFSHDLLDHPHYTRPAEFAGMDVPEVLLSGDHKDIENGGMRKRNVPQSTVGSIQIGIERRRHRYSQNGRVGRVN